MPIVGRLSVLVEPPSVQVRKLNGFAYVYCVCRPSRGGKRGDRMTGIWTDTGDGWKLGSPRPYDDEATLHRLIADYPQLLPLAGSPLRVLGSEVPLGPGIADILAVESSGRPTIIEVKLSRNREARREIVAQVLAYAAFLRGFDVEGQDHEGAVDSDSFVASLQEYLDQGVFPTGN